MPDQIDPSDVPTWPVVVVELRSDGQVRVDGDMFAVPDGADARQAAIAAVAATAALIGRPVRAEAREADGTVWPLIVTPEGQARAAGAGRPPAQTTKRRGFLRRSTSPASPASPPAPAEPATRSTVAPPQGPAVLLPPPGPMVPGVREPIPGDGTAARSAPRVPSTPTPTPAPDAETQAALDRILSELRDDRPAAARSRAQALVDRLTEQRGRNDPAIGAACEVLAYTTFVAGDAAHAARLYADLAAPRIIPSVPVDADTARLADNAQLCWYRSGKTPDTRETGARILALRKAGWGPDSPPARSAHRSLAVQEHTGS